MGFFDSITGFLGGLADKAVKAIAPSIEWKPSSLIKQAGKLLPGIVNAIPVVGPIMSNAVPAVEAMFGASEQNAADGKVVVQAKTPNLDEVKGLIGETLQAIKDARHDIEVKLKETIQDETERRQRIEKFEEYRDKIAPPVTYLQSQLGDLNLFLPYGANEHIKDFVPDDNNKSTQLTSNHDDLKKVIPAMETYIGANPTEITQEMFDLYLLACTWLLTYDKACIVLTLRSYLAQHYFSLNAMTAYTTAQRAWNNDYSEMVRHATERANIILGSGGEDGCVEAMRKARIALIVDPVANKEEGTELWNASFEDKYHKWAMGFAKNDDMIMKVEKLPAEKEEKEDAVKARAIARCKQMIIPYHGVQLAYFDACTKPAIDMADIWRNSVYTWQSRLPLSPPFNKPSPITFDGKTKKDALEEMKIDPAKQKGLGYHTADNVTYAVSYVTTYGEGFLSDWTQAKRIEHEHDFVKVKLGPVEFPASGLEHFGPAQAPDNKIGQADIIRRVYVKKAANDEIKIFHVADVSAAPKEESVVWDQAQGAYPKPNEEENSLTTRDYDEEYERLGDEKKVSGLASLGGPASGSRPKPAHQNSQGGGTVPYGRLDNFQPGGLGSMGRGSSDGLDRFPTGHLPPDGFDRMGRGSWDSLGGVPTGRLPPDLKKSAKPDWV